MTLPRPPLFLFFAMAGLLAGSFPVPLKAAGASCNDYRPTEIDVKTHYEDVHYDHTKSMLKIREMADAGDEGARHETWPVGLAAGQIYLRVTNDIFKLRTPYDPTTCGQIKASHIEIGFTNNTIYVAKELPKRSCPYKTVLEHEEQHKKVDRELLAEYTGKAKEFFAKGAEQLGMMRHPAGAAINSQVNEYMNDAIDYFSKELDTERKRRQKEVNSPEEYARVELACEGQLMEIVRNRLELLEATYPGITKSVEKKSTPEEKTSR